MRTESKNGAAREIALPASTLTALRRALRREVGPLATIHALHDTGYATGDQFYRSFSGTLGTSPETLGETGFWRELSRAFERRGWGSFEHRRIHPALGLLSSSDWAEADGEGGETQPGCAFTAGVISHLLTRVAGGPVAVLEVGCRSRREEECRFVFGPESAIHEVYGLLLEGRDLGAALAEL